MTDYPGIPEVTADDLESYVGVHEIASITGYSAKTIRALCQSNRIPHHQAGPKTALLFLVSEIRAWLRNEGEL